MAFLNRFNSLWNSDKKLDMKIDFTWVMRKNSIFHCKDLDEYIVSPSFTTKFGRREYEWRLLFYPIYDIGKENIAIYVEPHMQEDVKVDFSLCIIYDGSKWKKKSKNSILEFNTTTKHLLFERNMIIDDSANQLKYENIIIICDITRIEDKSVEIRDWEMIPIVKRDQLEEALDDKEFSDVIFCVRGDFIHGHRFIMAKKSPILAQMLEKVKEKNDAIVIGSMDPIIFRELKRFMYTGKVNDIGKYVDDLLVAADSFQLTELKIKCEDFICDHISIENALKYFKLTDRYEVPRLKESLINYITKHSKEMVNIPEFESIVDVSCEHILDMIRALSLRK